MQAAPGQRFHRLVVEWLVTTEPSSQWLCRCDCGKTKTVWGHNLVRGYTRSCGCLHAERTSRAKRTHGGAGANASTHTPEYRCWRGMKARCYSVNHKAFRKYGALGITVCDEWRTSYPAFLRDMGPKPSPRHSIDRIDRNGPYAPGNCRWATPAEQAVNRSVTRWIEHRGERRVMSHVAAEYGFEVGLFRNHLIRHGWNGDAAVHSMLKRSRNRKRVEQSV